MDDGNTGIMAVKLAIIPWDGAECLQNGIHSVSTSLSTQNGGHFGDRLLFQVTISASTDELPPDKLPRVLFEDVLLLLSAW